MQMGTISRYSAAFLLLGCSNPTSHGTQPNWESLSRMSYTSERYFVPTERSPYTSKVSARRIEFNSRYPIFHAIENIEFEGDRLRPESPRREVIGFTLRLPGDFCDNPYNFARLRAELEGIRTGVIPDVRVRQRIRREGGRLIRTYPDQEECTSIMAINDFHSEPWAFTQVPANR